MVEPACFGEPREVRGTARGLPCVQVRVEVDHRDGLSMNGMRDPEGAECDAVVAAQGEQLRRQHRFRRIRRFPRTKLSHGGGHLRQGHIFVDGQEQDVAAVNDFEVGLLVRGDARPRVVAAGAGLERGGGADGLPGPKRAPVR